MLRYDRSSAPGTVDDAGAGFASLRHILELGPDHVKLDRAIVRRVDRDPARQALVAGLVDFATRTRPAPRERPTL